MSQEAAINWVTKLYSRVKLLESENTKLRAALKDCTAAMNHAIALDYVGEGSTRGWFETALKFAATCDDLEGEKL